MTEPLREADPFDVHLTAAVLFRAEALALRDFIAQVRKTAIRDGVSIVFVKVSGSRLWIKEGDGP